MITTIYAHAKQIECDNCDEGFEADSWADAQAQMKQDGWVTRIVDGHAVHYCPHSGEAQHDTA